MNFFSIVIPTFKRKDEVVELLESLTIQEHKDFEVILADGTPDDSLISVVEPFKKSLNITHLHRPKLGISESRNLGVEHAKGQFVVFFDSDCIIPSSYLNIVDKYIQANQLDLYGGPDAAMEDFTPVQKAINHTMTSFLTTGGIRGKKNNTVGKFNPRGFNMGVRKSVYEKVGGFSGLKVSEDIDLSIRIHQDGYRVGLITDAFVYHKRRTNFKQFYRQVFRFGAGRIQIGKLYPGHLKLTHTIPAIFLFYLFAMANALLAFPSIGFVMLFLVLTYINVLFLESLIHNGNLKVAFLTVLAMLVQFFGYGMGFLRNFWQVFVLNKPTIV